jgi:hypothetical protein
MRLAALTLLAPLVGVPSPAVDPGPGALSHFDLARKDCVGTAAELDTTLAAPVQLHGIPIP